MQPWRGVSPCLKFGEGVLGVCVVLFVCARFRVREVRGGKESPFCDFQYQNIIVSNIEYYSLQTLWRLRMLRPFLRILHFYTSKTALLDEKVMWPAKRIWKLYICTTQSCYRLQQMVRVHELTREIKFTRWGSNSVYVRTVQYRTQYTKSVYVRGVVGLQIICL